MKKTLTLSLIATALAWAGETKAMEREQLFNHDWQFVQNDSDFTKSVAVTLPHDWSIRQRFDRDTPAGNDGGYLPTGKGWYRKTFALKKSDLGRRLQLYFEGVYMNSTVYVNGHRAGGHPYGYSSFFVDVSPYIHEGRNEVVVAVDNSAQKNCRWYSGSGIYRNVWLVSTPSVCIDNWGIQVTTPDTNTVVISTRLLNTTNDPQHVRLTAMGQAVETDIAAKDTAVVVHRIHVDQPQLWSPESPHLYKAVVEIEGGDRQEVPFGIRTIAWSADKGLLLNGKPVKLNGACVHHDNGILGAAAYDDAEYRKARLMKEAGFNAVRTSHNHPAEAFLKACDELGLLVIDEAFDGWREQKNPHDYSTLIDRWWRDDLYAMVARDRNHPSIFCWSIGNEVIERKKIEVVKTAHNMAQYIRTLDSTRPITSALAAWDSDWDIYDPLAAEHDIVGYNYMIHKATEDHQRVPSRVMMQTESFPRDAWRNYERTMAVPYIIGDFVWTGLDYLGESGIGRWYYEGEVPGESWERPLYPWHAAYCGDVDLTGLRKPISHYRSLLWNNENSVYMAVRQPDNYKGKIKETMWGTWPTTESWNWEGWEGQPIEVEVYSRRPSVRLYFQPVDGEERLVGEQTTQQMKTTFTLPYAPGTLRAETADGTATLRTAGKPAAIRLTADRQKMRADGQNLAYITVEVVDAQGQPVPTATHQLTFSVQGSAELLGVGNGDVKDEDPYFDASHRVWQGRALAVVRSTSRPGKATLTVRADGLPSATAVIQVVK